MTIEYQEQLAPTATAYDIQTFLDAWSKQPRELELRPAFQRNMVWNASQRSYLIDSILRGLPVPELYLQKTTSPDGDQLITVVDGQQRISACIDYVLGTYVLETTNTTLDDRWRGKRFDDLAPELRARIRSFSFIGRQLPSNLDEGAIREIFQRLNRTVEALEPQELRHAAYTGAFIRLVEAAADSYGLRELGVFSAKDVQRRRHDAFVSEIFFAFLLKTFPNKKDGLDEQYMIFEKQGLPDGAEADLIARFGRVNRFLTAYGSRIKSTRFRNKSDAYTLLIFLMNNAERIPTTLANADLLLNKLEMFSAQVNRIKRIETAGGLTEQLADEDSVADAASYLHAVERAASDRQNRVRRSDALGELLNTVFSGFETQPFTPLDRQWPAEEYTTEDDMLPSTDEMESELEELRRILADDETHN